MRVPLTLRRVAASAPTDALWLTDSRAEALIRLCGDLGIDPEGRCHLLAEGFLVELPSPGLDLEPTPRAFRMRRLAPGLWAPIDSELAVALLDDEVQGLTRTRGLVFSPCGKTMEYDPRDPIVIARLLARPNVRRGRWTSPPRLAPSASEIRELLLIEPAGSLDRVLETSQGIGAESHSLDDDQDGDGGNRNEGSEGRDGDQEGEGSGSGSRQGAGGVGDSSSGSGADSSGGKRVGGGSWARLLIGKTLEGAGRVLRSRRLTERGRAWLDDSKPRPKPQQRDRDGDRPNSEGGGRPRRLDPDRQKQLQKKHERAARTLLKEFREGDINRALRRALPIERPGSRDRRPADNDKLPDSPDRGRYSLNELMAGARTTTYWAISSDLTRQLAREYRKAAEDAARVGDFRRAAAIYGKLLCDYRGAAEALRQGGLHRDAALLLLHKLNDEREAAISFLQGGDVDQAVRLYLRLGDHEAAGDAYARAGETERAGRCYQDAIDRMALENVHALAGDLADRKLADIPQALGLYREGWSLGSKKRRGLELACLQGLLRLMRRQGDAEALSLLLPEIRGYFRMSGSIDSDYVFFCHEIAQFADAPAFAEHRETLRDWAMEGIAFTLSRRAEMEPAPADIVAETFVKRAEGAWPSALISDADHAFRTECRSGGKRVLSPRVSVKVVAASPWPIVSVRASDDGEVFHMLTERGEILRYESEVGRCWTVVAAADGFDPSSRLECDASGEHLFILGPRSDRRENLLSVLRFGLLHSTGMTRWDSVEDFVGDRSWLASNAVSGFDPYDLIGVWSEGSLSLRLAAPGLRTIAELHAESSLSADEIVGGLLLRLGFVANEDENARAKVQDDRSPTTSFPNALLMIGRRMAELVPIRGQSPDWPASRQAIVPPGFELGDHPFAWRCNGPASWEIAGLGEKGEIHWAALEFSTSQGLKAETASWQGGFGPYHAIAVTQSRRLIGVNEREVHWLRVGPNGLKRNETMTLPSEAAGDVIACVPRFKSHELLIVHRDGRVVHLPVRRSGI